MDDDSKYIDILNEINIQCASQEDFNIALGRALDLLEKIDAPIQLMGSRQSDNRHSLIMFSAFCGDPKKQIIGVVRGLFPMTEDIFEISWEVRLELLRRGKIIKSQEGYPAGTHLVTIHTPNKYRYPEIYEVIASDEEAIVIMFRYGGLNLERVRTNRFTKTV